MSLHTISNPVPRVLLITVALSDRSQILYLDWEQRRQLVDLHDVIDVEPIRRAAGQFRRCEREGDVARGREAAGKPVMQQVLLRRAHDSTGALGARRDAFAEDEDLAWHRARRCRPGVHAVDAVDPEDQPVILGLVPAYETAHDLDHLCQNIA